MSDYWIKDTKGRVLGPVGLAVLQDLASGGHINADTRASQDGQAWVSLAQFPETAGILRMAAVANAQLAHQEAAQRILLELDQLEELPDAAVFGVLDGAPLETWRTAFLAKVKKFHPASLPPNADAALQNASRKMFEFFRERFNALSRRPPSAAPPSPTAPPPKQTTPAAARSKPSTSPAAPTYAVEEFVGLERRGEGRVDARVRVTPSNADMFTRSTLINISNGGVLLAGRNLAHVGEKIQLSFQFEGVAREIRVNGKVVWENAANDSKHPIGFGVRFESLSDDDRTFIKDFVQRAETNRRK